MMSEQMPKLTRGKEKVYFVRQKLILLFIQQNMSNSTAAFL